MRNASIVATAVCAVAVSASADVFAGSISVDLGKEPNVPGLTVLDHQGSGIATLEFKDDTLYLDSGKVVLWQSVRQDQGDREFTGLELGYVVRRKKPLNANVLDALLRHPELIPKSWKLGRNRTHFIYFWGTVFQHDAGGLVVRCLAFDPFAQGGGRWVETATNSWLGGMWDRNQWAVIVAE